MRNKCFIKIKKPFVYRSLRRKKPMTLVIGARFKGNVTRDDGISGAVLIADRLVSYSGSTATSYKDKIILPANLPIAICAAGYSDLFNEFNRKIIEKGMKKQD